MKKLKIGLIGCGYMGAMHSNCYDKIENAEVAAVADLKRDKAEPLAKLSNAKIYGSGLELMENEELDAVDICLPTYLHTEHALKAMDKVKYLFIEKPIALTLKEGSLLLKKSKRTGCDVQVGQVIRFWDEYAYLKEIVDRKEYGKVVNANFRRLSPRPTWGWNDWLLNPELSGGAGQDLHIHDSDYVLYLFGKPKKISTVKNIIGEKNSYVNTICSYGDFVVGIEGTWDLPGSYPFNMSFRVVFEKAVVELGGGKLTVYTSDGAFSPEIAKKDIGGADFKGGNVSDLGGYFNELYYFTQQAYNNRKIERATLKDGTESLKFVLKELR